MALDSPGLHTKQEILSQPVVWKKTLERLKSLDASFYPIVSDYDQVIFTGCGSTYYLSQWAARVCEKETGTISRAVPASDLLFFPELWIRGDRKNLLVAVSRSAETTETILALKKFKAGGYGDTVTVTCYPDRELAQRAESVIGVPDAQEQSVAQTRSFSNMLLGVCWLISKQVPDGLPALFSTVGQMLIDQHIQIAERLGRAVWQDAVTMNAEERIQFLQTTARGRISRLTSLCQAIAKPFMDFYQAEAPFDWYKTY